MFELPLVVFFLGKVGLVDVATFRRYRRHVIVVLVAVAAMVTPPDVFSQVALAVPMLLLYELGIAALRVTQRREGRSAGE
jgi:sec-independent protein translocase protein TatC